MCGRWGGELWVLGCWGWDGGEEGFGGGGLGRLKVGWGEVWCEGFWSGVWGGCGRRVGSGWVGGLAEVVWGLVLVDVGFRGLWFWELWVFGRLGVFGVVGGGWVFG